MMTVIEKQYMDAVIAINRRMRDNEIDWEQRRYEIAKEVFLNRKDSLSTYEEDAKTAVRCADLLITELQKKKS